MIIKKLKSEVFGGLKNVEIDFKHGLNVIFGPNEAGKSTIVEAIFSIIFQDITLNRNKIRDKSFLEKYMPYPDGDCIKGTVILHRDDEEYIITKEWGSNRTCYLTLPDGQIISNENNVKEYISDIFKFGEAAYNNIVFAKQRDIKKAIEKIIADSEMKDTITQLLRKTVMELDGVSVNRLYERIHKEYDNLSAKWDFKNQRPENNRGIHNPYRKGCGLILQSYYDKEFTREEMKRAKEAEERFENISNELKEMEEVRNKIKKEIEELSKLQRDVNKRHVIEIEIKSLEKEEVNLKEINFKWPKIEGEIKEKREELQRLDIKIKGLEMELESVEKFEEKKKLDELIYKVSEKMSEIERLKTRKNENKSITDEDIKKLEMLNDTILTSKASLEAAVMVGNINVKNNSLGLWITQGVGEREKIDTGTAIKADGYLKMELDGVLDMEIRSGSIDFESLSQNYNKAKSEFNELLKGLSVSTLEDAKLIRKEQINIDKDIALLENSIKELLGEYTYESLVEMAGNIDIPDVQINKSKEHIEKEKRECCDKKIEIASVIKNYENIINEWIEKYGDHDNVLNELLEVKSKLKLKKQELLDLKPLPNRFNSAEEFNSYLSGLIDKSKDIDIRYEKLLNEFFNAENQLPDTPYEELMSIYKEQERRFNRLIKRAGSIQRIKQVFEKKLQEMDNQSFKPLIDSFNQYLNIITLGNYTLGDIDENFNVGVFRKDSKQMPIELLSSGAYDAVVLSLRFAMLENIYNGIRGFVILDDCLVDLDPERKKKAVEIIKKFAEGNQVIFTTCHPDNVELLGGNIINLEDRRG